MSGGFSPGQAVRFKAGVTSIRAWSGVLTFVRYEGTMDACSVSNGTGTLCDWASNLEAANAFDGEGVLCDACGQPFTEAEWGSRHDGDDGATVYHEDCCPECAIPSADDWADDFDPERLAELAEDAAEAAIGGGE